MVGRIGYSVRLDVWEITDQVEDRVLFPRGGHHHGENEHTIMNMDYSHLVTCLHSLKAVFCSQVD